MSLKEKEIIELKKLVQTLKKENEYLKSDLYEYQIITGTNGLVLLNPPRQHFSTRWKGQSCDFEIDIRDIVCITSDAKTKWICFNKKQESIDGIRHVSSELSFTGTIESFCKKYDTAQVYLCIISRSVAVNLKYYNLNSKKLQLIGNLDLHKSWDNISISSQHIDNFKIRKEALLKMEELEFRSKKMNFVPN